MNDITPSTPDRLLEALRQREHLLEMEMRELRGRLDEVRDTIGLLTSRPRGRPRAVRAVEPVPQPELAPLPDDAA